MELSAEQNKAVDEICHWLNNFSYKKPYYVLTGYAGTGKTTIIKHLLGLLSNKRIAVSTYVWKAADVLRKKGVSQACSIHSLIYRLVEQDVVSIAMQNLKKPEKEKIKIELKFELIDPDKFGNYDLIIIDEASMVNDEIRQDLESFGVPVLYVGDPFQLPPIKENSNTFLSNPDSQLLTIHRQALENPIIFLSKSIREGHLNFSVGTYGDSLFIIKKENTKIDYLTKVDQVICGYNKTRTSLNARIRKHKGYDPHSYPALDEKLIALNNCHGIGIFNGQILISDEDNNTEIHEENRLKLLSLRSEDNNSYAVRTLFDEHKSKDFYVNEKLNPLDPVVNLSYGYAITCHKSQGSQFEKVLVYNEPVGFTTKDKARWLYTAVTRASNKLMLCV